MSNWTREKINPIEQLKRRGWPTDHITYDPKMRKGDYSINRRQGHDGTLLFTLQLIEEPLALLAFKQTFHKSREKQFLDNQEGVHYTVGPMRLATVYGKVKLQCSETMRYPGQRESLRIPVRMSFANDAETEPK